MQADDNLWPTPVEYFAFFLRRGTNLFAGAREFAEGVEYKSCNLLLALFVFNFCFIF
jgi:hypothetical protein